MRHVTAIVGGLFITLVVYLIIWFFVRNMVEGLGMGTEVGVNMLVGIIAIAAGYSSYRATLRRR